MERAAELAVKGPPAKMPPVVGNLVAGILVMENPVVGDRSEQAVSEEAKCDWQPDGGHLPS